MSSGYDRVPNPAYIFLAEHGRRPVLMLLKWAAVRLVELSHIDRAVTINSRWPGAVPLELGMLGTDVLFNYLVPIAPPPLPMLYTSSTESMLPQFGSLN